MTDVEKKRFTALVWLRYYIETEKFDRTLPGSWKYRDKGSEWIPRADMMHVSRAFAGDRMREVEEAFAKYKIAPNMIEGVKKMVLELPYEKQVEYMEYVMKQARNGGFSDEAVWNIKMMQAIANVISAAVVWDRGGAGLFDLKDRADALHRAVREYNKLREEKPKS